MRLTLTAILTLLAATAWGQTPGQPCTTPGGNAGTLVNMGAIGQPFDLVCRAPAIPIPFDSQSLMSYGRVDPNGNSLVNGQNADYYIAPVAGTNNVDVTDTYISPPPTVTQELQYWSFTDPSGITPLTLGKGLPGSSGSTLNVAFPFIDYCCEVWRPFISTYTTPTGPTYPMQIGGTITVNLWLTTGNQPAQVDIKSDTLNADGSPANICPGPPTARVYLAMSQSHHYSYVVLDVDDPDNRWFSPDPVAMGDDDGNLHPGVYSIATTISAAWGGVFGDPAQASDGTWNQNFLRAVGAPTAIAVGFGGGCFDVHGWKPVTGSVNVQILNAYYRAP